ncbi:MAG: hypothetical protein AAGI51_11215 [Pseudomonadota bacterium]
MFKLGTITIAASALLTASLPSAGHAVTSLGTFVNDYGSASGKVDPGGNDVLSADFVTVSDQSRSRFSDGFDLSGLFGTFNPGYSIDRFELTLTFSNAGPSGCCMGLVRFEDWAVRVQGSDSRASNDDLFVQLDDDLSPQSVTLSVLGDSGSIDAFAHSVDTEFFEFWFSENTIRPDVFDLDQAKLEVFGEATVIPTPFALPMLASAFGLAALVRRRGRRKG